jgi:hypothetical protein
MSNDKKEIQEVFIGIDHGDKPAKSINTVYIDGLSVGKLTSFEPNAFTRAAEPIADLGIAAQGYHCGGKTSGTLKIDHIKFFQKRLFRALGIPKGFCMTDPWRGLKLELSTETFRFHQTMTQAEYMRDYYAANAAVFERRDLFGRRKRIRHKKVKRFLRKMLLPLTVAEITRQTMQRESFARTVLPTRRIDEQSPETSEETP